MSPCIQAPSSEVFGTIGYHIPVVEAATAGPKPGKSPVFPTFCSGFNEGYETYQKPWVKPPRPNKYMEKNTSCTMISSIFQ